MASLASFQRIKPELRFISKDGPRCSFAMASPFCSNGVKDSIYSRIRLGIEHIVEERTLVEESVLEEQAFDIY